MVKNNDQVSRDILSEDKVYEMGVLRLNNTENRIDSINKFYFSVFASLAVAVSFIISFLIKVSESSGLDQSVKDFFINNYLIFVAITGGIWGFHNVALRIYVFSIQRNICDIERKHSKRVVLYNRSNNKILYYIEEILDAIGDFLRILIPSIVPPFATFYFIYVLYGAFMVFIP